MWSFERKASLIAAIFVFLLLAVAVACKGFFVNQPTAVTITPNSLSLPLNSPTQLKALASLSDNSTKDVTKSATWDSSNNCIVSVSATTPGQVTAIGTGGSVTVTAIYNGVSGTATLTAPTGIVITPCGPFSRSSGTVTFAANLSGTDVTSSTTWSSSNSNVLSFASSASPTATLGAAGQATVTATSSSSTGSLVVTVQ